MGEIVVGHERLHAACKAAAVDTPCADAVKQLGAQLKAVFELAVIGDAGYDIRQQLFRRAAGLVHKAHILLAVAGNERITHLRHTLVFVEEMLCTAHGTVGRVPLFREELGGIDLP